MNRVFVQMCALCMYLRTYDTYIRTLSACTYIYTYVHALNVCSNNMRMYLEVSISVSFNAGSPQHVMYDDAVQCGL